LCIFDSFVYTDLDAWNWSLGDFHDLLSTDEKSREPCQLVNCAFLMLLVAEVMLQWSAMRLFYIARPGYASEAYSPGILHPLLRKSVSTSHILPGSRQEPLEHNIELRCAFEYAYASIKSVCIRVHIKQQSYNTELLRIVSCASSHAFECKIDGDRGIVSID